MVPLDREAGDRAQQIRLAPEALQMLDRLVDEQLGLLARALPAEQGDEGLLALGAVLADLLAGLLLLALLVEQVVGDLEGEADVAGIAAQRASAPRAAPAP